MKHLLSLIVWLINWMPAGAQSTSYSRDVNEKIRQVEQRLASGIRLPADKDWTIQERMQYYDVPGISIAVVNNYQIEWAKAYGWADADQRRPLTTQTRFQAGRINQAVHGTGVMVQVQNKKIDLFADINTYLTSWKFPYDSVAKGKRINLMQLLTHRAGLVPVLFSGYPVGVPLPTVVQILEGRKPASTPAIRSVSEPGVRTKYSGGGLMISQQLLMDVTGQTYDPYMSENVFKPLGMINSSYILASGKDDDLASGHDFTGQVIEGHYKIYPEQAATGLWTTPSDLARYMIEMQLAYGGKSGQVLTPETARLQLMPYEGSSNAVGLNTFPDAQPPLFTDSYGPSTAGFNVSFVESLTQGYGAVILMNSVNGFIADEILNSIARVYQWPNFYKPTVRQTVVVPESVLEAYVGNYQEDNLIYTITRENNRLFEHVKGSSRAELFPKSPTQFFFRSFDAEVEFVRDASGKVVKRTMVYNGQKSEAKRIN
ncbi:serine hydrolase [Dyadobacter flavalbus]|uniref:Serine hydrolase n=1 Tax=Dyadobacter flavalbus TaxID=2579942 RepID=A0A5M8QX31_9BACT|nr:serine hydrolase [Dyadobacter flavalbus]KAA6438562.1 serine hydrolase [Dyadobacter flavalbus]